MVEAPGFKPRANIFKFLFPQPSYYRRKDYFSFPSLGTCQRTNAFDYKISGGLSEYFAGYMRWHWWGVVTAIAHNSINTKQRMGVAVFVGCGVGWPG